MKTLAILLLAATLPLASACAGPDAPPPPAADRTDGAADPEAGPGVPRTALGRTVARAMEDARAKLATEDISLGQMRVSRREGGISVTSEDSADDGRPAAAIRPDGTLLVAGAPVAVDASQRALLLQYRGHLEAIASAGMDIDVQGADLGVRAATAALKGVFTGSGEQVEAWIDEDAARIEVAARALCDRMPALLQTQTALAASLSAFRPYATMDQSDVDDCYDDGKPGAADRTSTRDDVRAGIRSGIREGIRGAVRGDGAAGEAGMDAAAEADAAAASEAGDAP